MDLTREEFDQHMKDGQALLLETLATQPEVSVEKFYDVANFLEYLNLFGGVIFTLIENSNKKLEE